MANNNDASRIIIYGAGAIGGVVGGHLALAGTEVILVGRSSNIDVIRQNGLKLVTPNGTRVLKIAAVSDPGQIEFRVNDIVFLCVKSQDSDVALRDLLSVSKSSPVFCFQNGVRNEETAAGYFPGLYGVMVRVGAVFTSAAEVTARNDPPGLLVMGRYPTGTDAIVESAAARLRNAGFSVLVTPDVMPYKWGKLMLNLSNAVGAITNAARSANANIIEAAQEEADRLLDEAGIRWVSTAELARQWPQSAAKPRSSLSTEAQSSTWQSLARRQGNVETEFLNGEIVRLANRLGTKAPVNEALLRIVQEMAANHELPGKYTPEELARLAGLH